MTTPNLSLLDWLDDLCVRFIVNLPHEELQSVERICFQIEEAQWFYEDFIRPLDPRLPSMNLRIFSQRMFAHCPLFAGFSQDHFLEAFNHFLQYKTRVPVRGAIMLNEDMTHAVLVKGWKKGAKWSFPRGKINKDEPDLECAIREVYEETGLDLKEAGLVRPESEMKGISISMREQSMLLYVFRGVPMDTYFEPRTRKEISKIDWYKLSDLPTLKRKNQMQQGIGQDLIKDNSFYMVAPFLGPLKAWIKTQRKLDRQRVHPGSQVAPPPAAGVTDTEGLEADMGETTADEAVLSQDRQYEEDNFKTLVANLGNHRTSDALPEVSTHGQTPVDPAAELKRLLSVGVGFPSQSLPVEAPQAPPQQNPLLAILHGNNRPAPQSESLPRTPYEQMLPTPQLPQSPHGQHHPRPPHLDQMQPPPPFPFHHQQSGQFNGQQHPQMGHQQHNGHMPPLSNQFVPPHPRHVPSFPNPQSGGALPTMGHHDHGFLSHGPNVQQSFNSSAPPPYMRTGDPQFTQQQSSGGHGPAIPPASKLPPPKLTAHTLGLLNAFKINEKPAISSPIAQAPQQSSQATPIAARPPPLQQQSGSFVSPEPVQYTRSYAPSPPTFQSPPPMDNFEPVQPKPRNAHQDSLLSLFQSPSMAAAVPALGKTPDPPVELSAYPSTPGNVITRPMAEAGPPIPDMNAKPNLLGAFGVQQKPSLTSATVHGPVNAPDFATVKKNAHVPLSATSRGPSPALVKPEPKTFVPQQILRRDGSVPRPTVPTALPTRSSNASPATVLTPAAPFQPQILKRPQQSSSPQPVAGSSAHSQGLLSLFKTQQPSPQPQAKPVPVVPSRSPAPAHAEGLLNLFKQPAPPPQSTQVPPVPSQPPTPAHAEGLLNLFKQPAPPSQNNRTPSLPRRSPAPPTQTSLSFDSKGSAPSSHQNTLLSLFGKSSAPLTASPTRASPSLAAISPIPPERAPQPPTPKTSYVSGVVSPVSPFLGSQTDSPAQLNSRSRISSIGDTTTPSIVVPQPTAPTPYPQGSLAQQSNGFGGSMDNGLITPVSAVVSELGASVDGGKGKLGTGSAGKSPVDKNFLLGFLNDVATKGR